jgi:hypothetical protein
MDDSVMRNLDRIVSGARALTLAGLAAGAVVFTSSAAQAAADFSGYWMLKTDPASVPAAAVKPGVAQKVKALLAARGALSPKGSPEYAKQFCTVQGMPWQSTLKTPVDIRQGPLTVSMRWSGIENDPRHIYIDGQKQADPDIFDFTSVGHSIGRWQGDTLVVDTIGFGEQGVKIIPGGGLLSDKSKLVERYRLVTPDSLQITYTWTDPTTFVRPQTYTFVFDRIKTPVWMSESGCSPIRAMREKGLFLPPGAPQE